jgi:hypothetical protein
MSSHLCALSAISLWTLELAALVVIQPRIFVEIPRQKSGSSPQPVAAATTTPALVL